jgi:calmodulin-binding transcription activator
MHEMICWTSHLNLLIAYQGSISVSARNDSSTSNQNGSASRAEVHSSPGWTSEFVLPCPNSSSPGSAEEVSSRTVTINNETNRSGSDWIQHKAALRKLEMQLSLEDKEDSNVLAEEVPTNIEHVIVPGIQTGEPGSSANFEDIFNVLDFSRDHTKENGTDPCPSAIDVLKNSGEVISYASKTPCIPIL